MLNPIGRAQNTQFNYTLTAPDSVRILAQRPVDTLRTTQKARNGFSLATIWEAIVNCFTSLFGCFFNSTTAPSTSKEQIARIAARDGFVWFFKREENPLTAFLGNFYPCTIRFWGLQFQCAEAVYQAAKFAPDRRTMQRFQNLDGEAAYQLGRSLSRNWSNAQRNRWQHNNLQYMREIVSAKFGQNPDLADLLLATGNAYLVEHPPVRGRDAFWSDDHNGTGQNWLGRIAMEVRGNLGGGAPVGRNQQYNQFLSRQ